MKKVVIYTDGASRGNGTKDAIGAYGAILHYGDKKKEISKAFKGVTNNQMELMGVIEALKILKSSCDIEIFSDSKYVCDAFNKNWISGWIKKGWKTSTKKPVANKELWEELISLVNKHDASFNWVKGHADNKGNQRADKLCNLAMDEYIRDESVDSYSNVVKLNGMTIEKLNNCEWDQISDTIQGAADRKGLSRDTV